MWKRIFSASLLGCGLLLGQSGVKDLKPDPVKWSLKFDRQAAAPGQKAVGRLTATIEPGWHLYSLTTPRPPIATTVALAASPAIEKWTVFAPQAKRARDPNFNVDTETYEKDVDFILRVDVAATAANPAEVTAQVRYQACNDKTCLFPARKTAAATLKIDPAALAAAFEIPAGYTEFKGAPPAASAGAGSGGNSSAPAPGSGGSGQTPASFAGSQGTGQFILIALGLGFLAIFTPCVFPMIPITMSYFLGAQTGSRRQSMIQAFTFCIGVVILFTGFGAAVTAILGPFGIARLGSSPWVNLFIALVFLAFGLSLLGAFEITVPSGVLTTVTNASYRGGILGAFIMGSAFSLASFACTGPFVGTLLAGSAQGGLYWPILGMLFFSIGLASPFFFLALFPAYVNRMPRSGMWLERTKVTLGFLILAAMLKYLSSIDQVYQWNILTRERFIAFWIVMLVLAGLYLLGIVKLKEEKPEPVGLGRLFAAAALLVLAVSLVPGMFGAKLGELDAYIPAPGETSLTQAASGGAELKWIKDDYRGALEIARQTGKPILVSFTGYACTNCHWMKANMFTRPEIASELKNYVLVELYTDGTDQATETNQKMAENRFNTTAIPFYAIIRPDDTGVATFAGVTRDPKEFEAFLNKGLPSSGAASAAAPSSPAS